MAKLVFERPGRDEPGFLLRMREGLEMREAIRKDARPETLDKLVKFLANFISEPVGEEEKRQALLMASEAQIDELLVDLFGGGSNFTKRGGE